MKKWEVRSPSFAVKSSLAIVRADRALVRSELEVSGLDWLGGSFA